jgi:CoA:oxalate CoA-transferase
MTGGGNKAEAMTPILAGIRIIDFTRVLAGPFALLADLGAEVIKIESPEGDDYRSIGPMKNGESALFSVLNRNKKSVVLNLKSAEGREIARSLIAGADMLVENFRPGIAAKLGLGYDEIAALNLKLVYVSVSGFGQTGPWAARPAYDIIVQALSGLMEATGDPAGPPTLVGEAVSDVVAGLFASWAGLAGLIAAQRTGRGQRVDVAMFDTMLAFLVTSVARFLFTGRPARRVGNRHPLSAPFGVYRSADGHFVIAVLNSKLFAVLARAIGADELASDPRFSSDEARSDNEPELRARIEAWSTQRGTAEAVAALEAAGVPTAPIWTIAQALASDQARDRRLLHSVADAPVPDLPVQPVKFSGHAETVPRRAPRLGADTADILAELLGYTERKISELVEAGIAGTAKGKP